MSEEKSKEELASERRAEAFNDLIQLVLELKPEKYAHPWTDEMLFGMRQLLSKNSKNFPVKARPYIEIFKKFLFDNGQLIALAAHAHQVAAERGKVKQEAENSLLVRPTFEQLSKLK